MMNFECDTTLDRNTRRLLGIPGPGGGVTIFNPQGTVFGISTDYPYVKRLDAKRLFKTTVLHEPPNPNSVAWRKRKRRGVMAMSEKAGVKFESRMSVDEAISYFESIINSLKRGSVTITQGGRTLTLTPAPTLKIEVEAERKKDKEEITFEIKWRTPVPELMISSSDNQ